MSDGFKLALPGPYQRLTAGPIDAYYTPDGGPVGYDDLAHACALVPLPIRSDGLTVLITGDGEYWWLAADLSNAGLVKKGGDLSPAVLGTRTGTILFGTGASERTKAALGFQMRVALATWALLGNGDAADFAFQLTKNQTAVVGTYPTVGDLNVAIAGLTSAECEAGYFVLAQYAGHETGVVVNFKALAL